MLIHKKSETNEELVLVTKIVKDVDTLTLYNGEEVIVLFELGRDGVTSEGIESLWNTLKVFPSEGIWELWKLENVAKFQSF